LQAVETLLANTLVGFTIIGLKYKAIGLYWSINQGFPLASTLYVMTIEAIDDML